MKGWTVIRAQGWLLSGGLAVIAGLCSLYIYATVGDFFAAALREVGVEESVVVGGMGYRVVAGDVYLQGNRYEGKQRSAVLQLAYAKTLARHTPLLALAGTDPAALRDALEQLRAVRDKLVAIQADPRSGRLVETSLYPIELLERLADLEESRQRFLLTGSEHDAETYAQLLAAALDAYPIAVRTFRNGFEKAVPQSAALYATQEAVVDRAGVLHSLAILEAAGKEASRHAALRSWCLRGMVVFCNSADLEMPQVIATPTHNTPSEGVSERLLVAAGMNLTHPSIELLDSACVGDAPPIFMQYDKKLPAEYSAFKPFVLVGDTRFIPAAHYTDVPFYRSFLALGVEFVPDSPFSYYKCPRFGNDLSALWATHAIRQFAAEAMLSRHVQSGHDDELATLEQALAQRYISQSDALAYLRRTLELGAAGAIPTSAYDAAREFALAVHNHSAHLDQLLLWIASVEETNLALTRSGITVDLEAPYLFFVRSAFASLLLSNNRSVSPQEVAFAPAILKEAPYVWHSSLVEQKAVSDAELAEDIRLYNRAHGAY